MGQSHLDNRRKKQSWNKMEREGWGRSPQEKAMQWHNERLGMGQQGNRIKAQLAGKDWRILVWQETGDSIDQKRDVLELEVKTGEEEGTTIGWELGTILRVPCMRGSSRTWPGSPGRTLQFGGGGGRAHRGAPVGNGSTQALPGNCKLLLPVWSWDKHRAVAEGTAGVWWALTLCLTLKWSPMHGWSAALQTLVMAPRDSADLKSSACPYDRKILFKQSFTSTWNLLLLRLNTSTCSLCFFPALSHFSYSLPFSYCCCLFPELTKSISYTSPVWAPLIEPCSVLVVTIKMKKSLMFEEERFKLSNVEIQQYNAVCPGKWEMRKEKEK